MGRKKTYDRDDLIDRAMEIFRDHGFAGRSTEMTVLTNRRRSDSRTAGSSRSPLHPSMQLATTPACATLGTCIVTRFSWCWKRSMRKISTSSFERHRRMSKDSNGLCGRPMPTTPTSMRFQPKTCWATIQLSATIRPLDRQDAEALKQRFDLEEE